MQKKSLNIGIIGYGLSGRYFHLPFFINNELINNISIYSSKENNNFGNVKFYTDINNIIKSDSIDLVIIATPNHLHFDLIKKCLNFNKHVLVEKPFVLKSSQVDECFELAKNKNLSINVFHNRRFDRDFLFLKDFLIGTDVKDIVKFETYFDRFKDDTNTRNSNWRTLDIDGSGVLWDLGPHLIDQTICLFGLPTSLFCNLYYEENSNVDNYFDIIFNYENFSVTLRAGQKFLKHDIRFKLATKNFAITKYGLDIQEATLRKDILPNTKQYLEEINFNENIELIRAENKNEIILKPLEGNGYGEFFNILLNNILNGNNGSIISQKDIYWTIRLIEKCFESSKNNQVIFVKED